MADKAISQFPEITTIENNDSIPVVESSDPSQTKRITVENLKSFFLGYVLKAICPPEAPADGTTYFFGSCFLGEAWLTPNRSKIYIPKAGRITGATIAAYVAVTLGSSQASILSIRLNDSTDYEISNTLQLIAVGNYEQKTGLNIAVNEGDYIEIKWVTPTWITNPTSVTMNIDIYIEP